jgi:hypothetical protein
MVRESDRPLLDNDGRLLGLLAPQQGVAPQKPPEDSDSEEYAKHDVAAETQGGPPHSIFPVKLQRSHEFVKADDANYTSLSKPGQRLLGNIATAKSPLLDSPRTFHLNYNPAPYADPGDIGSINAQAAEE